MSLWAPNWVSVHLFLIFGHFKLNIVACFIHHVYFPMQVCTEVLQGRSEQSSEIITSGLEWFCFFFFHSTWSSWTDMPDSFRGGKHSLTTRSFSSFFCSSSATSIEAAFLSSLDCKAVKVLLKPKQTPDQAALVRCCSVTALKGLQALYLQKESARSWKLSLSLYRRDENHIKWQTPPRQNKIKISESVLMPNLCR